MCKRFQHSGSVRFVAANPFAKSQEHSNLAVKRKSFEATSEGMPDIGIPNDKLTDFSSRKQDWYTAFRYRLSCLGLAGSYWSSYYWSTGIPLDRRSGEQPAGSYASLAALTMANRPAAPFFRIPSTRIGPGQSPRGYTYFTYWKSCLGQDLCAYLFTPTSPACYANGLPAYVPIPAKLSERGELEVELPIGGTFLNYLVDTKSTLLDRAIGNRPELRKYQRDISHGTPEKDAFCRPVGRLYDYKANQPGNRMFVSLTLLPPYTKDLVSLDSSGRSNLISKLNERSSLLAYSQADQRSDLLVCLFPVAVQRVKGQRKGNRLSTFYKYDYECQLCSRLAGMLAKCFPVL
ncbi:Glutamine-dependent NAD(+) synthetase [Striga asiatica]|uniref:Glutamine-dependent NAD(+) synthetase n=1 Tax=Striga asiatica TaxID=4170 RepID=A0A5A7Q2P9_STRAF|nr:Glutamine-dependent NAD(+) synthetase [Striga asiatica]